MSTNRLGNILSSRKVTNDNFYVAGITHSQSGYLTPTLIKDTNTIDTIFGDFKYKEMYKSLIRNGTPVVLTPMLSPISDYNRSSLRLNSSNAYIDHTHPRYKKHYEYVSNRNVYVTRISKPTDVVKIKTKSKVPIPYLFTSEVNNVTQQVVSAASYEVGNDGFYVLTLNFNELVTGEVTLLSFPKLESNPESCFSLTFENDSTEVAIELTDQITPDIVVLDEFGKSYSFSTTMTQVDADKYSLKVSALERGGVNLTAYFRILTEDMVMIKMMTSNTTDIVHNLGYNPKVKVLNSNGVDSTAIETSVVYLDENRVQVYTDDIGVPKITQYNKDASGILYSTKFVGTQGHLTTSAQFPSPIVLISNAYDDAYNKFEPSYCTYHRNQDGTWSVDIGAASHDTYIAAMISYEALESNQNKCFSISRTNEDIEFELDNDILPDIVTLMNDGNMVAHNAQIVPYKDHYKCIINTNLPHEVTAYIRILDDRMVGTKPLLFNTTKVVHNSGVNPIINVLVQNGQILNEYGASVVYRNGTAAIVQLIDSTCTSVQYTIAEEELDSELSSDQIEYQSKTLSTIIDFSELTNEQLRGVRHNQYFMIDVNGLIVMYMMIIDPTEELIANDYYDEIVYLPNESDTMIKDIIDYIKSDLADRIGTENVLDFVDECNNALTEAWNAATQDYPDGEPGRDETNEYDYEDWCDILIDQIHARELFLGDYKLLTNLLEEYLRPTTTLAELKSLILQLNNNKLLVNFPLPSSDLNFYSFTGLKLINCFNSGQDTLCNYTEESKLIEFYSKIKGDRSEDIWVTIEKLDDANYYYLITIKLGDIVEHHYVYTKITDTTPTSAREVRSINQDSQLVFIKLYDYRSPYQNWIDQLDLLGEGLDNSDFDPSRVRDIELPECEIRMKRSVVENCNYADYKYTLGVLAESGYYPDLFLEPNPIQGSYRSQYLDILDYVQSIYSQALCTVRWDYLQNPNINNLIDKDNRMLYFYDDIEVENNKYPTFYHYIDHVLYSKVLRIPEDKMIADYDELRKGTAVVYQGQPYMIDDISGSYLRVIGADGEIKSLESKYVTKITELLNKLRINYLYYNNLYYYYLGISERMDQRSNFITQYYCSKVSRAYLDWGVDLYSGQYWSISSAIGAVIRRLTKCLINAESINFDYKVEDRLLKITNTLRMKTMVNKEYVIDIALNIN